MRICTGYHEPDTFNQRTHRMKAINPNVVSDSGHNETKQPIDLPTRRYRLAQS